MSEITYCGKVAIVGRPNVGKSTLLNALVGQKISIVSDKPHTTRTHILGLETKGNTQIIYVDTPGWQLGEKNKKMQRFDRIAKGSLIDVNIILLVIDASKREIPDQMVLTQMPENLTVILVLNKIDRIKNRETLLPYLIQLQKLYPFLALIPVSSKTHEQMTVLHDAIVKSLPQAPFEFPADEITDQTQENRIAEIIREKVMQFTEKEVPYSITIEIVELDYQTHLVRIAAIIWAAKKGQQGILIGEGGSQLKKIGQAARVDIEQLVGKKVYLQLWIKVKKNP